MAITPLPIKELFFIPSVISPLFQITPPCEIESILSEAFISLLLIKSPVIDFICAIEPSPS